MGSTCTLSTYAIDSLAGVLARRNWVPELAGILPLSALIDFLAIPPKLHILELAGAVPLWSWVITPSGSRLLLTKRHRFASPHCYQDRFGNTVALETLDGRYGERYFASSPETLRLVLSAYPIVEIKNDHENMAGHDFDMRIQNLEVVHMTRRDPNHSSLPPRSLWRQFLVHPWRIASPFYLATSFLGWVLLGGTMSAFFQTWISFAFLLLFPVTGVVVFSLYGSQPRRLLVEKKSSFNRLLVVSEHMNSVDWLVIYGESTLVNSLLNRPLEPNGPSPSPTIVRALYFLLRLFILGQWALALAAAATKDWNAYFICFWIIYSIFSHAYLINPKQGAKDWSKYYANLKVERYGAKISTRRALINTIVALNPDTFSFNKDQTPDMTNFYSEGLKWIDPILTRSDNRILWEKATREAMMEAQSKIAEDDLSKFQRQPDSCLSPAWNSTYRDPGKCYGRRFIPEGIYIAEKIKRVAGLLGRKIHDVAAED